MPSPGTWAKVWAVWVVTTILTGAVFDIIASLFGGYDSTLTCHVRKWSQIEPEGQYARVGRVCIVGFFLWAAAHLGWGVLNPIPRSWIPVKANSEKR
jgi:hypothetical protein